MLDEVMGELHSPYRAVSFALAVALHLVVVLVRVLRNAETARQAIPLERIIAEEAHFMLSFDETPEVVLAARWVLQRRALTSEAGWPRTAKGCDTWIWIRTLIRLRGDGNLGVSLS